MFISPHSPNGKKFRSKPQLVRYLGDTVDLTTFDYKTGKINAILLRKNRKKAQPDLARGFRNDLSVIPPIRQTASIFKQPVTIVKSQECKVRHELKHGRQEKPRQVYSTHIADKIKTITSPLLVSAAFLGETIGEPQIS
jgi:methyl-CpG-binding domain protein 2